MIIECFAQSILFLAQAVTINFKVVSVAQHLELRDEAKSSILPQSIHHTLYLTSFATVKKTISVSAENTLTLTQEPQPRVDNVEVVSYFTMWHSAKREAQWPLVEQALELAQLAEVVVANGTHNSLALIQEASYTVLRNLVVVNTLAVKSQAVGFLPSKYWTSYNVVVEAP